MTDKKNAKKYFILGAIVLALFVLLTLLIKTVDLKAVGPMGSEIGLSGINTYFRDKIGVNMTLYDITDILGYAAIAVAGCFAIFGVYQLIKGKSIKAVDRDIIVLGVFFAACPHRVAKETVGEGLAPIHHVKIALVGLADRCLDGRSDRLPISLQIGSEILNALNIVIGEGEQHAVLDTRRCNEIGHTVA